MTSRLAITPGEPAGIGPELLIQAVQNGCAQQLVAFADPKMLTERAKLLGLPLQLKPYDPHSLATPLLPGELYISAIYTDCEAKVGVLDAANARYVLACLDAAIEACQANECDGLVTGPVQKSIINDAGIDFSGHTEYLALKTHTDTVVMMLATDNLRVALTTTHLPLRDVADAITAPLLESVIDILNHDLCTKFGMKEPKILVCGLNPHAGEGGHLGNEEIDIISPVIEQFKQQGMAISGPYPADTLFTEKYLSNADAVLAMYHDQGLPVLKHSGFGRAANITLGLPIIRTSVDHGTALDLAGKGIADKSSFEIALDCAAQMAERRSNGEQ